MNPVVEIKSITKTYGPNKALDQITFDVTEQSIFGLLGPNGAGKTTLIRIINQIIAQDEGQILINGEPLAPHHVKIIGYLPEERGLYKKMTVRDHLIYLAEIKGLSAKESKSRIKSWMEKFDILDWSDKKIEELSKGMAQKVQFIATVIHEPSLIILDEPFSGFDPINADLIKNEILELREKGATIIFSTHRMESVEELCDHIGLINKAKLILSGAKREIKKDFRTFIYEVEHLGNLQNINGFEIVNQNNHPEEEEVLITQIKAKEQKSNDLLKSLIDQVEIIRFEEQIPTINEIFIRQVNSSNS